MGFWEIVGRCVPFFFKNGKAKKICGSEITSDIVTNMEKRYACTADNIAELDETPDEPIMSNPDVRLIPVRRTPPPRPPPPRFTIESSSVPAPYLLVPGTATKPESSHIFSSISKCIKKLFCPDYSVAQNDSPSNHDKINRTFYYKPSMKYSASVSLDHYSKSVDEFAILDTNCERLSKGYI
jgi:hypothetical protein